MSFQLGIGSLGGTAFFQVGLCTPLRTMMTPRHTVQLRPIMMLILLIAKRS